MWLVFLLLDQASALFHIAPDYSSLETSNWNRQPYPPLFPLALAFSSQGAQFSSQELPNRHHLHPHYDFVIVGGGSAGCVLANRLSENASWTVLLIEAGESENYVMDIPVTATMLQHASKLNWKYKSLPSHHAFKGMKNGQLPLPQGKVMGGSSTINYMIYTRGHPEDYDGWAAMGNPGWGWDDVLPYFKKSEDSRIQWLRNTKPPDIPYQPQYHNIGGYQTVSSVKWRSPLGQAFLDAGEELGYPGVDYNGDTMIGISPPQVTMKDGMRLSTNAAFLHPIKYRGNLHVIKNSHVVKIIINNDTKEALGVEYIRNGERCTVSANKEVIISAGAIGSPHLLMLSGVGPKKNLKSVGIDVIKKLPVGFNLMDHPVIGGVVFTINETVAVTTKSLTNNPYTTEAFLKHREGLYSLPAGIEALGFVDTGDSLNSYPDIGIMLRSDTLAVETNSRIVYGMQEHLYKDTFKCLERKHGYTAYISHLNPSNRGRIFLNSSNPFNKPHIYTDYFEKNDDISTLIKGIDFVKNLTEAEPLRKLGAQEHKIKVTGCRNLTDNVEYWRCHAKKLTFSNYNVCGTCKMGPKNDKSSVVDARLRVHGISRLRVVDASIMPKIPAAHLNAPTIMIAEKAADIIKQDWASIH